VWLVGGIAARIAYQEDFASWYATSDLQESRSIIFAKDFVQSSSLINLWRVPKLIINTDGYYWKDVSDSCRGPVGKVVRILSVYDCRSSAAPMIRLIAREIYHLQAWSWIDSSHGITKLFLVGENNIRIAVLPQREKQLEVNSNPSDRATNILVGNIQLESRLLSALWPIRRMLETERRNKLAIASGLNIGNFEPRSFRRLQLPLSGVCGDRCRVGSFYHLSVLPVNKISVNDDGSESKRSDKKRRTFVVSLVACILCILSDLYAFWKMSADYISGGGLCCVSSLS
jgi:hypothetical protein